MTVAACSRAVQQMNLFKRLRNRKRVLIELLANAKAAPASSAKEALEHEDDAWDALDLQLAGKRAAPAPWRYGAAD